MHTDPINAHCGGKADIAALLPIAPPKTDARSDRSDPTAFANALSIVTHDLKGPLANLALLVEEIERSAEQNSRTARNAAKADVIITQLSRMLSAVLARAKEGRDPLSCGHASVNLIEVLELVLSVNQPRARQKGIVFQSRALDPVIVSGDPDLLFEAVDNLISNAVRHTRTGGTIACEIGTEEQGMPYLRVCDEGPGFLAGDLLRAFRPFTRLSAKAKSGESSNGLGLWITRLIAERHGGRVEARNRSGGLGASLTLWIPTNESEEREKRGVISRRHPQGPTRHHVDQPQMSG